MEPASTYVICATPRSGSTLLCDLLRRTGVAGRPASYFRHQSIPDYAERLNVAERDDIGSSAFFRGYLDAVLTAARNGGDIAALRIMWESLGELNGRLDMLFPALPDDIARLNKAFGTITFIHLRRGDKLEQAISLVKAGQTGLWHMAPNGAELERTSPPRAAEYDPALLDGTMRRLETDDAAWRRWFGAHGIAPAQLTYEELSRDPRGALARILAAIGRDPAIAQTVTPGTAKMADAQSREWARRFRAEGRGPGGQVSPCGPRRSAPDR